MREGARAHHSLGQNFLVDDSVIQGIVENSCLGAIPLLEIGPGLGALTRVLARETAEMWAVEVDAQKVALLRRELRGFPVEILLGDALKLDLARLWPGRKGCVIGNLPYYITSPLLNHFLAQAALLTEMTVMVQKEVADRLLASPGGKAYGILSIAVRLAAEAEPLMEVPPAAFWPPPKVRSAVVRLIPRPYPGFRAERTPFFRVVKAAFGQRRKNVANSLAAGLGLAKEETVEILKAAGIDSRCRAETLGIEEFQTLTDLVQRQSGALPREVTEGTPAKTCAGFREEGKDEA
ncbi:ribosomal RNA small subunit methyltransferase A [Peptococcaceae bacterium CEB3]|nr:ribosomal RNA small subunit methyltransferase A [Peptococcaceae bacterium CEB3]